jgi:hypothetical protein
MSIFPVYYWDSCLFYEHLKGEQTTAARRRGLSDILVANKAKQNFIISSVLTPIEVFPEKLVDPVREAEFQSLFDGVHMQLVDLSENTLRLAREVKSYYYRSPDENGIGGKVIDTGDAIHLATAIVYGVNAFHTRDNQQKGSKVPLLDLYKWSGHAQLCGRFDLSIVSPESDEPEFFDATDSQPG